MTQIDTDFAAALATTASLTKSVATLNTQMAALGAAIAAAEKPPVLPESSDGTVIPPAASIIDAKGLAWTLIASVSSGNQIAKNGVIDPLTNNVTQLVYANHVVWQQAHGLWWGWSNGSWQPSGGTSTDPRAPVAPPTPPVPPPVAVAGTRNWALFDSPGNDPSLWANLNSGWAKQPIDGLHVFTDVGAGGFAGTEFTWVPPPKAILLTFEWGTPGSGSWPGTNDLGAAANGDYNAQWLAWLKVAAATTPAPIVAVRIYQEINADWMLWSVNQTGKTSVDGTPNGQPWPAKTVIAAWRNAAEQVKIALPKALIEWNLSAGGPTWPGQGPGNGTGYDLYPGDDLVDIVGIDVYEEGQDFATTQSGGAVNLKNLETFAIAHNKLIAVSETAAKQCNGAYITDWTTWLDSLGARAAYLAYYEANNTADSNLLGTTSGQPGACPANTLQAALNASSFGKPFGGTWMK